MQIFRNKRTNQNSFSPIFYEIINIYRNQNLIHFPWQLNELSITLSYIQFPSPFSFSMQSSQRPSSFVRAAIMPRSQPSVSIASRVITRYSVRTFTSDVALANFNVARLKIPANVKHLKRRFQISKKDERNNLIYWPRFLETLVPS